MGFVGGLIGQAPGYVRDLIRYLRVDQIGPRSVRVRFTPCEPYAERYYGIYINGILRKPLVYAPARSVVEAIRAVEPAEASAYVYIEDMGYFADLDNIKEPFEQARDAEAAIADKLSFSWTAPTTFSQTNGYVLTPAGDAQISGISITGMQRFTNCIRVVNAPTRGRLTYSIYPKGGHIQVRWWAGGNLVAEGCRTGDGEMVCTQQQESGIEITCTVALTQAAITDATNASPIVVTSAGHDLVDGDRVVIEGVEGNTAANGEFVVENPTADTFELKGSTGNGAYTTGGDWFQLLEPGVSTVDLAWPDSYQVHYSTGALSFPRTPEAIVYDKGDDSYSFVSPSLDAGSYNAAIVPVREGTAQDTGISTETGLEIKTVPAAPTLDEVTGNAAALTVAWAVGEAGCSYTVYYSLADGVVNYGAQETPVPVVAAVDATSATLTAITGYPCVIRACIRATKNGVQEQANSEFAIELDDAGEIVQARPNAAHVNAVSSSGLTLTLLASNLFDELSAVATHIDLFLKAVGTDLDFDNPQESEALATIAEGDCSRSVTITHTVGAAGAYHYAVRARTADGTLSLFYTERIIILDDAAPGGVSGLGVVVGRAAKDE